MLCRSFQASVCVIASSYWTLIDDLRLSGLWIFVLGRGKEDLDGVEMRWRDKPWESGKGLSFRSKRTLQRSVWGIDMRGTWRGISARQNSILLHKSENDITRSRNGHIKVH